MQSGNTSEVCNKRPRSLSEVVKMSERYGDIDAFLREFLDEFYIEPDMATRQFMLREEPRLVEDVKANAYLAAVAEHLALKSKIDVPDWAGTEARFLKRPFFPCGLESLKATMLVESPVAFRRRMIFVGSDPLYRPRKGL